MIKRVIGVIIGSVAGVAVTLAALTILHPNARFLAQQPHGQRAQATSYGDLVRPDREVAMLIVDLNHDGVNLIDLADSRAMFDVDGDGFAEHTAWPSNRDGILALDVNANGRIDSAAELFGSGAADGFTEIAQHDENGDGRIDSKDPVFNTLIIWRDVNGDGRSQAPELFPVKRTTLRSIDLSPRPPQWRGENDDLDLRSVASWTDRKPATIGSAWFANDQMRARWLPPEGFEVSEAARLLPYAVGYGTMLNLHQSITLDPRLEAMVSALVDTPDNISASAFLAATQRILYRWSEVEGIVEGSRGRHVDARHLGVLEALYGRPFIQPWIGNDPAPRAGEGLTAQYQAALESFAARLLTQAAISKAMRSTVVTEQSVLESASYAPHDHILAGSARIRFDRSADRLEFRTDALVAALQPAVRGDRLSRQWIEELGTYLSWFRHDYRSDGGSFDADLAASFNRAGWPSDVSAFVLDIVSRNANSW